MKRKFRIIVGMLLLAIPLCMNAQVRPTKPAQDSKKAKVEKVEKEKPEKQERPDRPEKHEKQKECAAFVCRSTATFRRP